MLINNYIKELEVRANIMINFEELEKDIVAAMLTIAWANTKKRDVSQDEIAAVYKNFGGKKK